MKDTNVFPNNEKEEKAQYCSERYKNLTEDVKQRLVEYRKKYYKIKNLSLRLVFCATYNTSKNFSCKYKFFFIKYKQFVIHKIGSLARMRMFFL